MLALVPLLLITLVSANRRVLRVASYPDLFDVTHEPMRSMIKEFEAENDVNVRIVTDNMKDTITDVQKRQGEAGVKAGMLDVITVDNIYTWGLEDYLLPIEVDLLPEDLRASLPPDSLQRFAARGGQLALPMYQSNALLYYRTDLLALYNFSEPGPEGWTWAEFAHIAEVVKQNELARLGDGEFDGYVWFGIDKEGLTCVASEAFADNGVENWIKEDGEVVLATDPRIKAALERMVSWSTPRNASDTPISSSRVFTMEESLVKRRFCQERRAMFARGWPQIAHDCNDMGMAGRFGITRLPGLERGRGHGTDGSEGLGIARTSKHPDLALKFIEFTLSEQVQTFWMRNLSITSALSPISSSRSACEGMRPQPCLVPLHDLLPNSTHARYPDREEDVEIIVERPSPFCPTNERIATVCDVDTANYSLLRPSAIAREHYEEVSAAFSTAVWTIIYNGYKEEAFQPILQKAVCEMIEKTKYSDLPLRAPGCDRVCPEGHFAEGDVCRNCGFFSVRQECLYRLPYVLTLVGAIMVVLLVNLYLLRMRAMADSLWAVDRSELRFSNPPEIVGRGTFGFVLRAECRGTEVAVKRVMAPAGFESFDAFGPMPEQPIAIECERRKTRRSTKDSICSAASTVKTLPYDQASRRASLSFSWAGSPTDDLDLEIAGATGGMMMDRQVSGDTPWCAAATEVRGRGRIVGAAQLRLEFIHEMRRLSKLRHPCVLTVMGAVISRQNEPMLISELMQHGSLRDLLQNETVDIEGELVLPILSDVAAGLRFLHASRVVHGDLRSQHVLVDSAFRAKLSGFGFTQKERLGLACGRAPWLAPELLADEEAPKTTATDVYAFGVLLVEVYTRGEPYPGKSAKDILAAVLDPHLNRRPDIPESCSTDTAMLMRDCWKTDADLRPDASELWRRLQAMDASAVGMGLPRPRGQRRHRTWQLMCDVFPQHVAEALREGRRVEPDRRDAVTIFFSDIVGFTDISATLEPQKVSDMLNRLYSKLDALSRELRVFKVETIGDAYMAVSNLVEDQQHDHARRIALFAREAIAAANGTLVDVDDPGKGHVNIRVGFHSGPVVANVVGTRNLRYCLFGDTVNTAARMESNSQENMIHCSEIAAEYLMKQAPDIAIKCRGIINVKGKGNMRTFWVDQTDGPDA